MDDHLSDQEKLEFIAHSFGLIEEKLQVLDKQIRDLERKQMTCAKEWYKAGKYLYLVYPTDSQGHRKREYIGADPKRIQSAKERLQCFALHRDLVQTRESILEEVSRRKYDIDWLYSRAKKLSNW